MIIIKSVSIPLEYAIEIDQMIESGLQHSFSGFVTMAIGEQLNKHKECRGSD